MFPPIDRRPRPNEDQQQQPNEDQQPPEVLPGLRLDWEKITGEDFDNEVKPWLEKVGDREKQLTELRKLKAHFEDETFSVLVRLREREPDPSYSSKRTRYQEQAQLFGERLDSKIKQLLELQKIEEEK